MILPLPRRPLAADAGVAADRRAQAHQGEGLPGCERLIGADHAFLRARRIAEASSAASIALISGD